MPFGMKKLYVLILNRFFRGNGFFTKCVKKQIFFFIDYLVFHFVKELLSGFITFFIVQLMSFLLNYNNGLRHIHKIKLEYPFTIHTTYPPSAFGISLNVLF